MTKGAIIFYEEGGRLWGGTRISLGSLRGGPVFFTHPKGGPEFFHGVKGGTRIFLFLYRQFPGKGSAAKRFMKKNKQPELLI